MIILKNKIDKIKQEKFMSHMEMIYDAEDSHHLWNELLASIAQSLDCSTMSLTIMESHKHSIIKQYNAIESTNDLPITLHQLHIEENFICATKVLNINIALSTYHKDGYINDYQQSYIRKLLPHLQKVLSVNILMNNQDQPQQQESHGFFAHLPLPALIIDNKVNIKECNQKAEQLFIDDELIKQDGQLRLISHHQQFVSFLEQAFVLFRTEQTIHHSFSYHIGNQSYRLSLSCFHSQGADVFDDGQDLAVLVVQKTLDQAVLIKPTMTHNYHLSPAEFRLAHLLVQGKSLDISAHELAIKHSTARTQLQAIFAKTSTKKQHELVSKLLLESFACA